MTSQRRAVLLPRRSKFPHARKMQQHRETRLALHQRSDRRLITSKDEIAFPMTGDLALVDEHGAPADHDLWGDELFAATAGPCTRHTQRMATAQAHAQLARQRGPTMDVQSLVDSLVRDAHRLVLREINA